MLARRLAGAAALTWLAGGCIPNAEVSFEPLPEGVGNAPLVVVQLAGAAGQAGAGSSVGEVPAAGSDSGSAGAAAVAAAAGAAAGGSDGAGAATGGGGGATGTAACSVVAWSSRDYVVGERVTSVCEPPYNGLCARGERHEFECRPPTGVVGLAWCRAREPGVGNGWNEAWLLKLACPP